MALCLDDGVERVIGARCDNVHVGIVVLPAECTGNSDQSFGYCRIGYTVFSTDGIDGHKFSIVLSVCFRYFVLSADVCFNPSAGQAVGVDG